MDSTHIHLLLDRIREAQHQQWEIMQDIAQRQGEALRFLRAIFKAVRTKPAKPSPLADLLPKVAPLTLAQYGVSALLLLYVLKGGDILTAVQMLGKLFGGP